MPHASVAPVRGRIELRLRLALACSVLVAAVVSQAAAAVAQSPAPEGRWLAGDLHIHTCFSHDAYCPGDDNTGPDQFYTYGVSVRDRFLEASRRGLGYLAITDHNDVRSSTDPGFATSGVVGIPGYEASISGHAQMLGARQLHERGDRSAAAAQGMADGVRAEGGVFQANHPGYRIDKPFATCGDTAILDWEYAYDVRPDTVEVWNPAGTSNEDAEAYWECWLGRGERVAATGGSDSHYATLAPAQGAGQPTTWVFAREATTGGVLQALREGRTTISSQPPALGGARLVLQADGDRDGSFEAMIGDTVAPGSPMRARVEGMTGGEVDLRGNGRSLMTTTVGPGGEVRFFAPAEDGWVRAKLRVAQAPDYATACAVEPEAELGDPCRNDARVAALTSAIYLRADPPSPSAPQAPTSDPASRGGSPIPVGGGRRFLISRRARKPGRDGTVSVEVSCRSTAECRGVLSLRASRRGGQARILGRGRFAVPAGRRARIRVRPNSRGRRVMARPEGTRVLAVARLDAPPGEVARNVATSFRLAPARIGARRG